MGVNKVEYYGETLIDTTRTTVSEETLAEGETAINAAGEEITGKLKAVQYKAQNPTAAEQAQARENIDALGTADLPAAINTALAEAKESGQFDGKDGQDGQPGSNGKDGSNGVNGKDGVGIDTLQQVVESTESEGENVWRATLTDGKTSDFTVRNGRDGVDGKTAYESAQDGGYAGTEQQFMKTLANCVTRNHEHEWRQIVDRPFGEFAVGTGANTVISNDIVYGRFVKVSDATPTLAEVQRGGKISYYKTDQQYGGAITGELVTTNYPQGDLTVMNSSSGVVIAYDGIPLVVVAFEDGAEILFNTYEKGTHFNKGMLYFCVYSLTINGYSGFELYETRTIPEKYLPEDIGVVKTVNNTAPDENGNVSINTEADKAFNLGRSNTIKWDGNTEGLANIGNADFKVSDEAPTISEAQQGGNFKYKDGNELKTFTFASGNVSAWNNDIYAIYGDDFGEVVVVTKDGASFENMTNLEKGTYISSYGGKYISEVTFNGYQFKNINLKSQALSEHTHGWYGDIAVKGNTVKTDCLIHGESATFVKVSDATPSLAELKKGGMIRYYAVSNGTFSELYTSSYLENYFGVRGDSEASVIAEDGLRVFAVVAYKSNPASYPYVTEPGIYLRQDDSRCVHSLTINEYEGLPLNMEKIPAEFLPEDIGTGGGGGGVSSWNDLTDKPFGETTTYGDTLTWDGDMIGRPVVTSDMGEDGIINFCKVSESIPTLDDISNGVIATVAGMGALEVPSDSIDAGDGYAFAEGFCIISKPNATVEAVGLTFHETGTWLMSHSLDGITMYIGELTIPNYTGFETTEIKTIDSKYIPISKKKTFYIKNPVDVLASEQPRIYTDKELTVKATPQKVYDAYITDGVFLAYGDHKHMPLNAYSTTNEDGVCGYIRIEILYDMAGTLKVETYSASLLE